MKKIILLLALVLSSLVFADHLEDSLEMNLMRNYPELSDGNSKVFIKEYDVDIKKDRVKIEIELSKGETRNKFEKLSRVGLDRELKNIIATVRKELNNSNLPVKIEIELDEDSFSKKVYNKYL
ncbi:MAG: hypothetical protein ACRC6J_00060 [Cetobacterium sp.]